MTSAAELAPVDPHDASNIGPPNPFPPLAPDEHGALRTSIERFGVLYPIVVDHEGAVLDGHHRLAIATELGVTYRLAVIVPIKGRQRQSKSRAEIYRKAMAVTNLFELAVKGEVIEVAEDADLAEVARTLNFDRRHLTTEQRLTLTAELRAKGTSIRGIAKATGVSKTQVGRDIEQVSPTGHVHPDSSPEVPVLRNIDPPITVTGTDGKTYRASKPKKPRKTTKAESRAQMVEMAEKIRANTPEAKRKTARQAAIAYIEAEGWRHFLRLVDDLSQEYGTP